MKDKSGWLLGNRLLEMMCILEIGDYDLFYFKIDTFSKLLYSIKDENIARTRNLYKLLRVLMKTGFNYKELIKQESELFSSMLTDSGDNFWNPTSYEIIRVDKWLAAKAGKEIPLNIKKRA